ncbi:MAG: carbohydrate binding domain-containing protein, partial [Phycisphaerae bacterium]
VWVDGVPETENPDPDGVATNEMPLLLGENPEATGRFYDGLLDDVRIYDRALSADELSGLATLEAPANILANGGFEDGVPDPWSTYGDATLEVVQELAGAAVPEAPIEGGSCLHVVVGSAGANFWDSGLQHAGHVFEAGKQYKLSVFLKCKEGTLDINLKPERGESPWEGYGAQIFTMTDTWAEYSVTTPVFEAEVVPATITFHIAFAPGEFWVDDARFVEVE